MMLEAKDKLSKISELTLEAVFLSLEARSFCEVWLQGVLNGRIVSLNSELDEETSLQRDAWQFVNAALQMMVEVSSSLDVRCKVRWAEVGKRLEMIQKVLELQDKTKALEEPEKVPYVCTRPPTHQSNPSPNFVFYLQHTWSTLSYLWIESLI